MAAVVGSGHFGRNSPTRESLSQSNNGGRQSTDPDHHEAGMRGPRRQSPGTTPGRKSGNWTTGGTIPTLNRASSSGQKDTLKNSQAVTVTKVKSGWDVRVQAGFDA